MARAAPSPTNASGNDAVLEPDEDAFVDKLVHGLTAYPAYYAHMGPRNLAGPDPVDLTPLPELAPRELAKRIAPGSGSSTCATAPPTPRTTSPAPSGSRLAQQFATWLGLDDPVGDPGHPHREDAEQVADAHRQLVRIGIDRPEAAPSATVDDLAAGLPPRLLPGGRFRRPPRRARPTADRARRPPGRRMGHRAYRRRPPHPAALPRDRLDEVPDRQLWVHCPGAYRASIAAGLLDRAGYDVCSSTTSSPTPRNSASPSPARRPHDGGDPGPRSRTTAAAAAARRCAVPSPGWRWRSPSPRSPPCWASWYRSSADRCSGSSWARLAAAVVPALRADRCTVGYAIASKPILQLSIVVLGTGLSLQEVVHVGGSSLPVMLGTLAIALGGAWLLGRLLGVRGDTQILIGVGTGICGASAIAATTAVIKAKQAQVAYAIGTIFTFNIAAVLLFPPIGHLIGMSPHAFGLWAGTAINDTSSVVAASFAYGGDAGSYGIVVKLTRTLMLIPIVIVLAVLTPAATPPAQGARRRIPVGRPAVAQDHPLFLVGFIAAATLDTVGVDPRRLAPGAVGAGHVPDHHRPGRDRAVPAPGRHAPRRAPAAAARRRAVGRRRGQQPRPAGDHRHPLTVPRGVADRTATSSAGQDRPPWWRTSSRTRGSCSPSVACSTLAIASSRSQPVGPDPGPRVLPARCLRGRRRLLGGVRAVDHHRRTGSSPSPWR